MSSTNFEGRFDGKNHWVYDKNTSRSLCEIKCFQNRTHFFCEQCKVHLCLNTSRNCFLRFHTHDIELLQSRKQQKLVKSPITRSQNIENKAKILKCSTDL